LNGQTSNALDQDFKENAQFNNTRFQVSRVVKLEHWNCKALVVPFSFALIASQGFNSGKSRQARNPVAGSFLFSCPRDCEKHHAGVSARNANILGKATIE
jgi:hypothetical protein